MARRKLESINNEKQIGWVEVELKQNHIGKYIIYSGNSCIVFTNNKAIVSIKQKNKLEELGIIQIKTDLNTKEGEKSNLGAVDKE